MDLKQRAEMVRAIRLEMKQRPRRQLTSDEQREQNATRWLRTVDRRRPKLGRNEAVTGDFRARVRAYEQDRSRTGGFRVGETLRAQREAGGFGVSRSSETHAALARRSNVRIAQQTRYLPGTERRATDRNWTERVLTPSERVNTIGVASRRRRVSPGMVPEGPPRRRRRNWFGN